MSKTRRDFIRIAAGGAAGLMLAVELPAAKSKKPSVSFRPNAWPRIGSDGTSLPMIVRTPCPISSA